jgi:hypothetical protein
VSTGAYVLAQFPSERMQSKSVDTGSAPRSDGDRLHAVEQKLDRILEALGGAKGVPGTPAGGISPPDLLITGAVTATPTNVSTASVPPGTQTPPEGGVSESRAWREMLQDHLNRGPATSSPDRLTSIERRMDNLERRLVEIERCLYPARATPASTSPTRKSRSDSEQVK